MNTLPEDIILHISSFIKYPANPANPDPIVSLFSVNKRLRRIFCDHRNVILGDIANRGDFSRIRINESNNYIINLVYYSQSLNKQFKDELIKLPFFNVECISELPHNDTLEKYRARYLYCHINLLRYNKIDNKHEFITLMLLFHDPLYESVGSNDITNDTWKFNYNLLSLYYRGRKYSEKELDLLKFIVNKYAYTKKELIDIMNILLIHGRISSMNFIDKYIL